MENNLQLNHLVPTVASDGHIVMVSDQGIPTILFFQARSQSGGNVAADVVAAVRLNGIEDLRALTKAISETIKKHESREP